VRGSESGTMASVMGLHGSRDIHKDDSNDDDIDGYIGLEVPLSITQHKMKLNTKAKFTSFLI
jgi:hypothetical protein